MKTIVVLGGGESGVGAALLAQQQGFNVFLSDSSEIKKKYKEVLYNNKIDFEEGKHSEEKILCADEVIKSPGIPNNLMLIQKIKAKGVSLVSEIEFAYRFTNAKIIAITGSNGKTTTANLLYYILKSNGINVGLAGNVGNSFAWSVTENQFDVYVLEISSFQLDDCVEFRADIAILTNITPDHLDRYNNEFQEYIDAKFKIVHNQTENDYFIYCSDDEVSCLEVRKRDFEANLIGFSVMKNVDKGAYLDNENIIININDTFIMQKTDLALKGTHNVYNSMAAGIGSKLMDIRNEGLRECLAGFKEIEHRLEKFLKVHGILFINDSKATNTNSTWYAIESMEAPTIWIVGGIDKGNDYSMLRESIVNHGKIKAIVCLGKDNKKIHQAFDGLVDVYDTQSMEEAVRTSYYLANDGDNVLLSPACASFDLFANYEERGHKFKEAVRNL